MKLDGKMIAQAMLRRKENKGEAEAANLRAEAGQLEPGSHIEQMQYFAECLGKGDHEGAHGHLSKIIKMIQESDKKKKEEEDKEDKAKN